MPYRYGENYAILLDIYGQFFSSKNYGVTWLTPSNYDTLFLTVGTRDYSNIKFFNFDSNVSLMFKHSIYKTINFEYTNDRGENVKLKEVNEIAGYKHDETTYDNFPICSVNNRIVLAFPGFIDTSWKFTLLYVLTKDINLEKRILLDSVLFYYINSYKDNELIAFVKNYKYNDRQYSILKSVDTGSTWIEISRLSIFDSVERFDYITLDDDYLYFSYISSVDSLKNIYKCNVYQTNLKDLQNKLFFELENTNIYFVSLINEKYLLSGCRIFRNEKKILPFIATKELYSSRPDDYIDITPSIPKNSIYWFYERKKNYYSILAQGIGLTMNGVWFANPKKPNIVNEKVNELKNIYF